MSATVKIVIETPGSEVYLDNGFTDYGMEDDLKKAEGLNLFVACRKNSKRPPKARYLCSTVPWPSRTKGLPG